jgi:hypothetical protein
MLNTGAVSGFAVFRFTASQRDRIGRNGSIPVDAGFLFENHAALLQHRGFATGAAIANLSSVTCSREATIWDQGGSQLGVQSFALLGNGHMLFNVASQWTVTDIKQGIIVLQASGGGLTGLGLRFSPCGTFASVPTVLCQ